jgi:hypothetical protein
MNAADHAIVALGLLVFLALVGLAEASGRL